MTNSKSREPVTKETPDLLGERIEQLRQIFPEAFTEGKVDFEKLRTTLGDVVDERPERYSFSWAGKHDAIRLLQTPSRATLVPCPEESVNYHKDTKARRKENLASLCLGGDTLSTQNLFIEGDNLEVLKLLYKAYFGRVKMIYIDPPYNTGNDFVYPDNYADPLKTYLELTQQITSNPETSGRYHSAWLSMMYPRLFLARQLLREDGVIFVSIDDHEVHNLQLVMNEVFGEENFVQHIIWNSKYTVAGDATTFSSQHEHILCYARNYVECVIQPLPRTEEMDAAYKNPDNDPRGPWKPTPLHAKSGNKNYKFVFKNGRTWTAPSGRWPRFSPSTLRQLDEDNRIWFGSDGQSTPNVKTFLSEVKAGKTPGSVWKYEEVGHTHLANEQLASLLGKGAFDNPKPVGLIKRCLQLSTNNTDLILDFFAGSCTTAQAVLELNREDGGNRRFIMVQLPEPTENKDFPTIADIGKERIRRVIAKMQKESAGKMDLKERATPEDLGFKVFKLAPSNYKQWVFAGANGDSPTPTPEEYVAQMKMFIDSLVEGWQLENVIYEVALKEGYGLNCRIEFAESSGVPIPAHGDDIFQRNAIYRVTDPDKEQSFYICLADKLQLDALKPLPLTRDTLFICRDIALDDQAAANLALQCRLKTI